MTAEFTFTCPLAHGLHARPATMFAEVVRALRAKVTIARAGGQPVDLTSVLSVVGLDIRVGEACVVRARGEDEQAAIRAIEAFVRDRLPRADDGESGGVASEHASERSLPRVLHGVPASVAHGQPAGGGVGFGGAVIIEGLGSRTIAPEATPGPVEGELAAVRAALARVTQDLARGAAREAGVAADLLRAHRAMADDPVLHAEIDCKVREGMSAAGAVIAAGEAFASRLRSARSEYIRDRALDVLDVCTQILEHLPGAGSTRDGVPRLDAPSVILADLLTPSQLIGLDAGLLRGLVLSGVGATSHVVVLARSRRIPTVLGVHDARRLALAGTPVIVDGDAGLVVTHASDQVRRYYERESQARTRASDRLRAIAQGPARTREGVTMEVAANASSPEDVNRALTLGADGVGLLRTELLFMDRETPPGEDEQYEAYSTIVRLAQGRPVIIRTLDIGGDKPANYIRLGPEQNPFLGVRGVRLYPAHLEIVDAQLRAILRASAHGPVKIMAPMISTCDEAAWFKRRVEQARATLVARRAPMADHVPVGVMLEVPSVATVIDQLARTVEFFSLGTNDLSQYWMAAERGNPGVADLCDPCQPSFLRLLRNIVSQTRASGRWIGVCGEMAAHVSNLPLMLGLGVDEISVGPGDVAALKAAVNESAAAECARVLEEACACQSAAEVASLLGRASWRTAAPRPIVEPAIIAIDSKAGTKDEAIHEAVCMLVAQGRASGTRMLEDAIWAREATYSTGLGYGFAVPHAASGDVSCPSLGVIRLAVPIAWGSLDDQPVRMVFLLVTPASGVVGGHMRVFATLARRLMHETFRERLLNAESSERIITTLREELGLD